MYSRFSGSSSRLWAWVKSSVARCFREREDWPTWKLQGESQRNRGKRGKFLDDMRDDNYVIDLVGGKEQQRDYQ
jgi:hypothetical protein